MKLADDAKLGDEISTEEDWNILQEDDGKSCEWKLHGRAAGPLGQPLGI